MRRSCLLLTALALLAAGCRSTRCEELTAAPVAGSYRGGGSLGEERLLNVALRASSSQVVLTYTAFDGSRLRATYRVAAKRKQR